MRTAEHAGPVFAPFAPPSARTLLDDLVPEVYEELRRMAKRHLAREAPGHTLDSGELVHEVYIKLAVQGTLRWQNRAHFVGIAARAMRTLLVDHARARTAAKRGGGAHPVTLERAGDLPSHVPDERLIALDDALVRLAAVDDEAARMVECRYFAGLTLEEAARVLGVSVATARRRWAFAKAWLRRALEDGAAEAGAPPDG